jgi:hypothetical protein
MTELKGRLQADLTTAMKARDELTTATLRMLLTAVTTEQVAGSTARELSDDEVLRVVGREAKKRRAEQAQRERDEETVLARYLPSQLDDAELAGLVSAAIAEAGATEARQLGQVMKLLTPRIAGRADGKRVSGEVRRQLGG